MGSPVGKLLIHAFVAPPISGSNLLDVCVFDEGFYLNAVESWVVVLNLGHLQQEGFASGVLFSRRSFFRLAIEFNE